MSTTRICILLVMTILFPPLLAVANPPNDTESSPANLAKKALVLAIEDSMVVRRLTFRYGFHRVETTVIAIPVNEDIIDTAVTLRATFEKLDEAEATTLRADAMERYINGDRTTFALYVLNSGMTDDDQVMFSAFQTGTLMRDEENREYEAIAYTRVFDEALAPGVTRGYVHFATHRHADTDSLSLHFAPLEYRRRTPNPTPEKRSVTFVFDETNIGFLALIQKGLDEQQIREKYGIKPYVQAGVKAETFFDIINLVIGIVTLVK